MYPDLTARQYVGTPKRESVPIMDIHEYKRQNEERAARVKAKIIEKMNAEKVWYLRRPKWWDIPSDRFSFLVAAFTGALAFFSIWQLTVMRGQLDAMERDEQPNLSIGDQFIPPEFIPATGDKGAIGWAWNLTNFGKGEASEATVDAFIRIGVDGRFKRSPDQSREGWMGDIPAGRTNNGLVRTDPIYTAADFSNLKQINFAFGLLLEIQYFGLNNQKFTRSICFSRFNGGGIGIDDPRRCKSQKEK
jgi:hypothetical protein